MNNNNIYIFIGTLIVIISILISFFKFKKIEKDNIRLNKDIYSLKKNSIEKFDDTYEEQTIKEHVIEQVNKIYDIDVGSIRNLGAISKSLLTGKNYHKHNSAIVDASGTLVIPANVEIDGTLKSALYAMPPIGTIIMFYVVWNTDTNTYTVPAPNTTGLSKAQLLGTESYPDDETWYPCVGATAAVNGIIIPDFKLSFPLGAGSGSLSPEMTRVVTTPPIPPHVHELNKDSSMFKAGGHIHLSDIQIKYPSSLNEYNTEEAPSEGTLVIDINKIGKGAKHSKFSITSNYVPSHSHLFDIREGDAKTGHILFSDGSSKTGENPAQSIEAPWDKTNIPPYTQVFFWIKVK